MQRGSLSQDFRFESSFGAGWLGKPVVELRRSQHLHGREELLALQALEAHVAENYTT